MPTLIMEPSTSPGHTTPKVQRTAVSRAQSLFVTCLRRCAAAHVRLILHAPGDTRTFIRGIGKFPERRIDPSEHAQWEGAYRVFCGRSRVPHDRGSWRILAVDADDRVIGAITARFFCGEVVRDYLHTLTLLASTGPVFREHVEIAVRDVFTVAAQVGRTPAEISHWAVTPGPHARLIAATLARAMGALAAAFEAPVALMAADHYYGDVARLLRLGSAPLGRSGKFALPPFVHHASGSWMRLLLLDGRTYHLRSQSAPAQDLALLRVRCSIISAG